MRTGKDSRLQRPPSLEPAVSRTASGGLSRNPDFQSKRNPPPFRRWMFRCCWRVSFSSRRGGWWTAWDSNPRPRRCERRALPTELAARGGLTLIASISRTFRNPWRPKPPRRIPHRRRQKCRGAVCCARARNLASSPKRTGRKAAVPRALLTTEILPLSSPFHKFRHLCLEARWTIGNFGRYMSCSHPDKRAKRPLLFDCLFDQCPQGPG